MLPRIPVKDITAGSNTGAALLYMWVWMWFLMRVWRGKEGGGRGGGGGEGGMGVMCVGRWVVCGEFSVCSVRCGRVWVCGCVGEEGEEAKAILGDGGIGTAGEGGGLGTHVVLACPTCLQVLGVFTPSACWRLLSHVLCVSA